MPCSYELLGEKMSGFMDGSVPWSRINADKMNCPYCGERSLIRAYADIDHDDMHIDLYCESPFCSVRTMAIVAIRTEGYVRRADAEALRAIDEGAVEERLPSDVNIMDIDVRALIEDHSRGKLARRLRPTKIEITPII